MQKEDWNIFFSNSDLWQTNIEVFGLEELYNQHKDYAKEIVFHAVAYEASFVEALKGEFLDSGLSETEIERIVWGNYIRPEELGKRPLARLSHDIIKGIRNEK